MESKISMNEQRYNYNKGITNERKSINILKVLSKILGERKLIKPINIGLLLIYVLLNTVFLYNAIYKKMLSDMNYGYY